MNTILLAALLDLCGTSAENDAALRALHERNRLRVTSHASTSVRHGAGVFVMQSDARVAVNDHPFDLAGSTITAARVDEERFALASAPLQYRDPGPRLATLTNNGTTTWHYRKRDLSFAFSLGGANHRSLYISAYGAIFFEPPPAPSTTQISATAAIAAPQPVVAPVLMPHSRFWASVDVHVREEQNLAVVTWKWLGSNYLEELRFRGDVQAVLHANGNIEFSYASFDRFPGGAAIITTGTESARQVRETIATTTDPGGDPASATPAEFRDIVDIRAVEIGRIAATDVVEIRIDVAREINLSAIAAPGDRLVSLSLLMSGEFVACDVRRSGTEITSSRGNLPQSTLAISGSSYIVRLPRQRLPFGAFDLQVYLSGGTALDGDVAEIKNISIGASSGTPQTDVSLAGTVRAPIVEAFLLPTLDPSAVWDALEQSFALSPAEIDGVAIYTTFPTDIDLTGARAYASSGNSGADGVRPDNSSSLPRRPTLLHMNLAHSVGPILHEFGHRWLFFASWKSGATTHSISLGAHPISSLNTASAWTSGSSTMGGMRIAEVGGGMYQRVCGGDYGYSWLDLYLMGLARPEEVPEIFDLGNAPTLSCNEPRAATKNSGTMQQLVDSMGVRNPPYATSRKTFRVAYVLVENQQTTWPAAESTVRAHAAEFSRQFAEATGGRGSIVTVTMPSPPRRRAARH